MTQDQEFDIAVIGLGGMGSQTLMHLAQAGCRAIGLDQFEPPHSHGSSHGLSRLIRLAYFEKPEYVPLLKQAYELWDQLERSSGRSLWVKCGLLEGGPPDSPLVQGLLSAAQQHNLALPHIPTAELQQRFPGFALPADWTVLFEAQAGFLRPEVCIETSLRRARQLGAEIRTGHQVEHLACNNSSIKIETEQGSISASRVILTLGPWSPLWKTHIDVPIQLLHKSLLWFNTDSVQHHVTGGCPCFLFDADGGFFYGMPAEPGVGLKLARHDGGTPISTVDESVDARGEVDSVERFAERYFAPSLRQVADQVHCRYSMSPDGDFVLGQSPHSPRIYYLAGLSGHGFKFASVLGKVAAEWAMTGRLSDQAKFLSRLRFDHV